MRRPSEVQRLKDVLDRIWVLVEFDGRVPEEIIDDIDSVISAYRYGETVASPQLLPGEEGILERLKRKKV